MDTNKKLGKDQDKRSSENKKDLNKQQTSTTRTNEEKLKGSSRLQEDDEQRTGQPGKSNTSR